ncbi:gamma-glutamyltranspeptidase [Colletotrichum orchidophilum]|uniref:Glutathione hydrolase n=1 Tax=Colletotrichum orchidophilum TaxID=1209926 RepID=A0A1G4AYY5_9PEZI|nr:gamma-glutamyltranspeptidase [Colletotrichum orchidophilum]OHE94293.1 gamma-glutamyltranspeptidase [Colletotrichum orchidophilum]
MKFSLTSAALAQLLLGITTQPALAAPHESTIPKLGAVASESAICSKVGTDLLELGGNAADATVGTVICVGVVSMYHSSIAGGGFMLVRSRTGEYEFIDFREKAPRAAEEDMYKDDPDASMYGGLASGVPGELRGLERLHRYGKLDWSEVLKPAIKLARDGWPVNHDLIRYMNAVSPNNSFLTNDPSWAIDFAPHGTLLKLGDIITRKRYAETLQKIADNGADAFYNGPIAKATIDALTKSKGIMTLEDLRDYKVAIRDPAQISYRGYKLTACNAPSGGIVALSALNIVEGYKGFGDPAERNTTVHRLDEAMRFAYGQRTKLGDPFHVNGLSDYTKNMISPETGAKIRSKISDSRTFDVSYYNPEGTETVENHGTSQIAVADASGMAISLTTTVNLLFGSQLMVPETGVIMNNQMNDFSIPGASNHFGFIPSRANYIRSGKRPLSSIAPVIVEKPDGKLYFVIGSAGGSRIITAVIQNLHNVLDRNLTVPQSLAEPRFHDQLSPNTASFEYAYDNATSSYLASLGTTVTWEAPGGSSAQGVRLLPNGTFEAGSEPRQKNSGGFAV